MGLFILFLPVRRPARALTGIAIYIWILVPVPGCGDSDIMPVGGLTASSTPEPAVHEVASLCRVRLHIVLVGPLT